MAQDIVSGLFGLSPNDVAQQQWMNTNQAADKFAQMSPLQRSAQMMFKGGSGLAQTGAGMLGIQNPQIEEAKMTEAALTGLDISDPKAIAQRAQQIQDPRLKMKLMMLAQQKMAEIQKMNIEAQKQALAERKQTHQEDEVHELRKMEAEARIRQNDQRIQDARTTAQERMELMRENNQIKMLIAGMRQQGQQTEKPMTPAQQMKLQKEMSESAQALRGVSDAYFDATNKAEELKKHPGLGGATGVRGMFPSMPGSQAAQAETLLEEFKAMTKNAGLQLVRQGGSIGQMTEKEWPIVEAMVANIDPVKLGKEETKRQIDKVVAKMEQVFKNAERQHQEQFGEYQQNKPAAAPASPVKPKVVDFGSL